MIDLRLGDCLDVLRTMPDRSVHCCVTSPPYFGLRDYGADGQIGLEATPEAFVAKMVAVFAEVRRVLRDDGTLWLNLGDSFAGGKIGRNDADRPNSRQLMDGERGDWAKAKAATAGSRNRPVPYGLKSKDLIGIPWRVAFALQADGWYLRSDIIWHKPNPMPESVRDRPTKAHEYLFLMSKSERYHYDADAVREEASETSGFARQRAKGLDTWAYGRTAGGNTTNGVGGTPGTPGYRNRRSVWSVATRPFKGAHFATFPPKLIEPCILAGTSEAGCCPECGKPWERVVERAGESVAERMARASRQYETMPRADKGSLQHCGREMTPKGGKPSYTLGFRPACPCDAGDAVPCTVLDPFNGAGTTGVVAKQHGRRYVGIELNPEYLALSGARIEAA